MAEKSRPSETNGFDPEKAKSFVSRIESMDAESATAHSEYMAECKARLSDKKSLYTEAKNEDIPVKELKAVIRTRKLERQAAAQRDGLDDIVAIANFDNLRLALGDLAGTPLGARALSVVGNGKQATA